jgi:anhydro-N-acetylmuramic acid kinase
LSSPTGLTIAFAEFHENAGGWTYELNQSKTYAPAAAYTLVQKFIEENNLQYRVALVTIHSEHKVIAFNGASVAASTGLPVITDLEKLDVELGGNGEFYSTTSKRLNITGNNLNDLNKTICIAFMGILRWREEYNFLSSITGASRSSIGGAVWLGQEA